MLNCVIIDDEQPAIDILKNYVSRMPELNLIATFTNPIIALEHLKTIAVDLIFLDIQMNQISGIEFMKKSPKTAQVIFCTAYSEFAVAGFELEATDYLVKPVSFDRFEKAVQRAIRNNKVNSAIGVDIPEADEYIFIKTEQKGKVEKVFYNDIFFIEAKGNYVSFQVRDKRILTFITLKDLEEKLPSNIFMRVHKSYIVSLPKVIGLENSNLKLQDGTAIPLSLTYKDSFLDRLKEKLVVHS